MGAIQASLTRDPSGTVRDELNDDGYDFTQPLVGKTNDGRLSFGISGIGYSFDRSIGRVLGVDEGTVRKRIKE
jgi:hypothetical protein